MAIFSAVFEVINNYLKLTITVITFCNYYFFLDFHARKTYTQQRKGKGFEMRLKKGFLVVFEGIDGAGKTTQANLLYDALVKKGLCVVKSKEPTDSIYGQKIRKLAMGERDISDPQTEYNLFLNDRRVHVENFIKPALKKNNIVILDRYYFSTIAYQGALGMDPMKIKADNEKFAPIPDFVFLLEVPPRLGLSRIRNNRGEVPNLFEQEDYLHKVDAIFKSLNEKYILELYGSDVIDVIHRQIMNSIEDLIGRHIDKHRQCMLFDDEAAFKKIRAIKY